MSGKSFRILAVRVGAKCSKKIIKCLKPDYTYFLCDDYENEFDCSGKWVAIKKKKTKKFSAIPADYFSLGSHDGPRINVSAIVGKNGSGKSSLTGLIMRILYCYASKSGFTNSYGLNYINNVYASLFFEIDGILCKINIEGDDVSEHAKNVKNGEWSIDSNAKDHLFYCIVSDFSVYSYIESDFEDESFMHPWVRDIYHMTDKYQSPLCLTPTRDARGINIEIDRDMSRLRLLSMYTDAGDDVRRRIVSDGKEATAYHVELEEEPKLFAKIMRPQSHKGDTLNFCGINSRLELLKSTKSGTVVTEDFSQEAKFWNRYVGKWKKYDDLINIMSEMADNEDARSGDGSFMTYLSEMPNFLKRQTDTGIKSESIVELQDIILKCRGWFTADMLSLLVYIIEICENWEAKEYCSLLGDDMAEGKFASSFSQFYRGNPGPYDHAMLYIVYKTYSIFKKYSPWKERLPMVMDDISSYPYAIFGPVEGQKIYYDAIKDAFTDLVKDDKIIVNYYTIKLRQTANFLKYKAYDNITLPSDISFCDLHKIAEQGKKDNETMAMLPPPFIKGEIMVKPEDGDEVEFSSLSSGEQQLILTMGSILYHLHNLDYTVDGLGDNMIDYNYVNIAFEEVELYMHPEYQRNFLYRFIEQLNNANLKKIKGINITIVTHSPFILSDIPKSNVLFLEDGLSKETKLDTLGANIHEMLCENFFMENTIGEYTVKKINSIISLEDQIDNNRQDEKFDKSALLEEYIKVREELKYLCSNFSDEYVRSALTHSLADIEKYFTNQSGTEDIERLREKRLRLEKELAETEDKINSIQFNDIL